MKKVKKLSLAYFSPFPPQKSGISYYSLDLLIYLSEYYNIDIIYDNIIDDEYINKNYKINSIEYFEKNHSLYDRIIYHFGNSPYHLDMLKLLDKIAGFVILHDFFISDLINHNYLINKEKMYYFNTYTSLINNSTYNDYPCNVDVLNNARGTIVHSNFAKSLISKYYYKSDLSNIYTVPLLKKPSKLLKDLNKTDFIVSTFGLINKNKLPNKIIEAWKNSILSKQKNCYLIFVGEDIDDSFSEDIKNSNIIKTNWVDTNTYSDYLKITDIAIQLRSNTKGESSAALLDTMNNEIATITNAATLLGEFPNDCLFTIDEDFDIRQLTNAINTLYKNKELRVKIANNAFNHIQEYHNPEYCTKLYYKAIEDAYSKDTFKVNNIKNLFYLNSSTKSLVQTISLLDNKQFSKRQILVDVSSIIKEDLNTGIQRVVKSQLTELIKNSFEDYRIEPIYLKKIDDSYLYFYAREFTSKLLKIDTNLYDEPIKVKHDDIFYGLDLVYEEINISIKEEIFKNFKNIGLKFVFLVYDILPIIHPKFFPKESKAIHENWLKNITSNSDLIICISNSVLKEVSSFYDTNITFVHLGSNFTHKEFKLEEDYIKTKEEMNFLVVGTIEPRKGHKLLLETFELFWNDNINLNLHIVGKKGWMVDELYNKIKTHNFLNKNLFFYEGINDESLEKLYKFSDCVIVPSEAEGFGLPIIEAAFYNKAIIARDIEVFKEVGKNFISYFPNDNNPKSLYKSINHWIKSYKINNTSSSKEIPILTWKENAIATLEILKKL
ncbi:glycosyltransferase [Poseidonibacter antarcticus]|uniref:glycosyltransferase n=1 Tax=Poseidonibacter antarcticus TaxID=2478538 RepID=UPI000EF54D84|nr:glycosyltransferase [Poseidonibacter antarcticus]